MLQNGSRYYTVGKKIFELALQVRAFTIVELGIINMINISLKNQTAHKELVV